MYGAAPALIAVDDADAQETETDLVNLDTQLPAISVIVPVRNDPANLERCLAALEGSNHFAFEIIVIDDASTDSTREVARRHDVKLLAMEDRVGPAAARNKGIQAARFPYLFFVDADVCVRPETVSTVAAHFASAPEIVAFFGSYDSRPGAHNLVSQYRNLLHHYTHQNSRQEASTFWTGCGAIQRSVLLEVGGFDAGYDNASIEDIELGSRLRQAGYRVELVKTLQVKHLKRWTLWPMVRCDIENRGVPWTRLLLRQGQIPNDLNLRYSQRWSAVFSAALVAMLGIGAFFHPLLLLVPIIILSALLVIDRATLRRPVPRGIRIGGALLVTVLAAGTLIATPLGGALTTKWALAALAFAGGIVVLNLPFYRFFVAEKHVPFALAVLPLHVIYYLCSGIAFAAGVALHLTQRVTQHLTHRR